MSQSRLDKLPEDVLLHIASHLAVPDILTLRKTCSDLARFTRLRHVWHVAAERGPGLSGAVIPPYCRPVAELSSLQLELFVRHADHLRSCLDVQARPAVSVNLDGARPVTWVHILRGQWLLTASSDASVSALSLWNLRDILSAGRFDCRSSPATTAYLEGPVAEGLVEVQNGRVVIALEIRSPDAFTEVVGISMRHGAPAFVRLARLPGVSRIHSLCSSVLGFALLHEVSIPCIIDWQTKELTQIRERPDVTGGCIAMAFHGIFVAVITAKCLQVYARDLETSQSRPRYQLVSQVALPYAVLDAVLMFVPPTERADRDVCASLNNLCTLRLCLTSDKGLSVFDAVVRPKDTNVVMHPVWTIRPEKREDTRPTFGKQTQTLSWYTIRWTTTWSHMSFSTATIPPPSSSPALASSFVSTYEVSGSEIPALHLMGVRDYDETLGILVLANACGEMGVYDISGRHSLDVAEACFRELSFTQYGNEEIIPVEPIAALSAPPYPCSTIGPGLRASPARDVREAALSRWKQSQPQNAPQEWTTEFYDPIEDRIPWWSFVSSVGKGFAWNLERGAHFLGAITPLLYRDDFQATIFKAGGLLFAFFEETRLMFVLDHDMTATDAAHAIDNNEITDRAVFTATTTPVSVPESHHHFLLWQWEQTMLHRNRWAEFQERGGKVDAEWLTTERWVPEASLHWERYK